MKKSERLNQELIFLKGKKSFQLRDLMEEFAISKWTALRDIEELETLGVPLYTEAGRRSGYRLLPHALSIPIYFTDEESTAILFALQALQNLSTTPFDKSYRQIYEKLWAALSPQRQKELQNRLAHVAYLGVPSVTASPCLKAIFSAAGKRRFWQVRYRQKQAETLTLYIHQLFFQTGVWYFKGYENTRRRWYILRCDCAESCRPLAPEQTPPFPFADETAIERSLARAQVRQETLSFICRLTAAGREHFLKNDFYHMKLQTEAGGTFLLTGTIDPADLPYLIDYFISFGRGLQVLGPASVAKAYKQTLREMLES